MKDKEIDLIEKWRVIQQEIKDLIIKKNDISNKQSELKNILINIEQSIINNNDKASKIVNELKDLFMEDK